MGESSEKPFEIIYDAVYFAPYLEGLLQVVERDRFSKSDQQKLTQLADKVIEQKTRKEGLAMIKRANLPPKKNLYLSSLVQFRREVETSIKEGDVSQEEARIWLKNLHFSPQDES